MNLTKNRTVAFGAVLAMCLTAFAGMCIVADESDADVQDATAYVGTYFSQTFTYTLCERDDIEIFDVGDPGSDGVVCGPTQSSTGSSSYHGLNGTLSVYLTNNGDAVGATLTVSGTPTETGTVYVNGLATYSYLCEYGDETCSHFASARISVQPAKTYDTWTGSTNYTHNMDCRGIGHDSYTVNVARGEALNDIIGCDGCEGYATYSWNTLPSGITVTPLNIRGGWEVHITGAFQTAGTYVLSVTCPESCGTTTITYVVTGDPNSLSVSANNISGVSKLTYTNQIGASANNGGTVSYAVKSCTGGTATVNSNGLVTYTAPSVNSTTSFTVTVTVTGTFAQGGNLTRDVSFTVTVDPVLSFTNAATSGTLSVKGA